MYLNKVGTIAVALHLRGERVLCLPEDAIRLLDGRQSGLEPLENFGDILDTRSAGE
jgi:hypothetical protein